MVKETYVSEEGRKIISITPKVDGCLSLCLKLSPGWTVLAFTWSFLQQLLQGSFTPEPGEKKEMFTFSLLFLIVSELVVCVELIFSVWIAAAYKDHSFRLLVPSTDGKSVRIRVGSFLC